MIIRQPIFRLSHIRHIKKLMPYIGGFIALVSMYYVGDKLVHNYATLAETYQLDARFWVTMLVLSLLFGVFSSSLAFAWRYLIHAEGFQCNSCSAIAVFGQTQIAKYFPGNIFHLVGRQVLAASHGIAHAALLKSTIWEIVLHAFAAGLLGASVLIFSVDSKLVTFYSIMLTGILLFSMPAIVRLIEVQRAKAFACYISFHLTGALCFVFMMHYFSHDFLSVNQLLMAAGAYSLAWLAGFVIPGAPGGLGVREFVLYALISPWVDDKVLLMAIASSRIVTTLGDVVFYIMGLIASVKPKLA